MINRPIVFRSMMLANDVHTMQSGREEQNAIEFAQIDEIAITRDQSLGIAGAAGIEKFVVVRIWTDRNKASQSNNVVIVHKDSVGSFAGFGGNAAVKFFAGAYAGQFVPHGRRDNQCSLIG